MLIEIIKDFIEEKGWEKVLLFFSIILFVILGIVALWGLEKNVTITHMEGISETVTEDIVINVVRQAKAEDGFSAVSMATDMLSGLNTKVDTINEFNNLISACDNVRDKKQQLEIPKGAGYAGLAGIEIYEWTKKGQHFLTGAEFSEIHYIMIYSGQYIHCSMHGSIANISLGANLECGEIK